MSYSKKAKLESLFCTVFPINFLDVSVVFMDHRDLVNCEGAWSCTNVVKTRMWFLMTCHSLQVLVLVGTFPRPFNGNSIRPPLSVLAVPLKCHHREECQSSATRCQKRFGSKVSLVLVDPPGGEQSTPARSQLSESIVVCDYGI